MTPDFIRSNRRRREKRVTDSLLEKGFRSEEITFMLDLVGATGVEPIYLWGRQAIIDSHENWLDMLAVFDGEHIDGDHEGMEMWLDIWGVSAPPDLEGFAYRDVLIVAMIIIHSLYRIEVGKVTPYFLPFPAIMMRLQSRSDAIPA